MRSTRHSGLPSPSRTASTGRRSDSSTFKRSGNTRSTFAQALQRLVGEDRHLAAEPRRQRRRHGDQLRPIHPIRLGCESDAVERDARAVLRRLVDALVEDRQGATAIEPERQRERRHDDDADRPQAGLVGRGIRRRLVRHGTSDAGRLAAASERTRVAAETAAAARRPRSAISSDARRRASARPSRDRATRRSPSRRHP